MNDLKKTSGADKAEFIAVKYCACRRTPEAISSCSVCKGAGLVSRDLTVDEILKWAQDTISAAYEINKTGGNSLWVCALPNNEAIKIKSEVKG